MTSTTTFPTIVNGLLKNAKELDTYFSRSTENQNSNWHPLQLYICSTNADRTIKDFCEFPLKSFATFEELAKYLKTHDMRVKGNIGTMLHYYADGNWVDMII